MSDSGRRIINIVVAILVSIGAWTFVVYNDDPMIEVKYSDIPITFAGEDTLANEGLGVYQVSAETVDVTLKQQRIDTASITAEDIDIIADVSSAAEGENSISLQISGPEGTQITDAEMRSVSIEVEQSASIETSIYIQYEGDQDEYEPVHTKNSSTLATVIGAESEVSRVDKVAALLSLDQTGDRVKNFTSRLTALDKEGEIIDHLVIYPGEINFNAYTGTLKEVPLKVVTTSDDKKNTSGSGKSDDQNDADSDEEEDEDDGYSRSVAAPSTIMIKGAADAVDGVDVIYTEPVDTENMYDSQDVTLECILPDGIYLANGYEELTARVSVARKAG